ncbi:xylulokinase [Oharaeibacter diazotrophicus]|uniref:Xylulose kinase n=3 Tax=Oharaeibacter diazotrophicus TaxID=1920512 RepID=A0A4R6RAY8_9HYPH|nr:xylulokinase [Oharaeibacter diazotrophicus]TDP83280.1 xylulokinase [Oharaeibacter diazotrophicus]BBE72113.1 xylulose kinase [Pleomorphomonas sp. SM30]GLS78878.1 xylulokinase [Oharaeibacter diazotrophicus]
MSTYLGIDVGTSSVKAVLIGDGERLIGSATAALDVSRPRPGWSEQDPDTWIAATATAVDRLKADHPAELAAVAGIGLSGQMHGATLLDAADKPLRPAILWNDGRSAAECAELEARCPELRALTGNIAMPGFTAPKLVWTEKHEPEIFARTAKVLLPKDYVRLWLTGEHVSDMSDSAGTLWLDVGARAWSDRLLEATRLDRSHMPRLVEGTEVSGDLRPELAARWGLAGRAVVAGGGGDNAASAVGMGAVRPGVAFASLGTSGVLFVSNAAFSPNTAGAVHAFCHAVPGTWHQMGVVLSAAASLEWLSRTLGEAAPSLTGALGDAPSAPAPVMFLPYLSGERTPHNDADIRGAFVGLAPETDRRALTQAVLEGVAFAFRDCLGALNDAGTDVARAFAVGGGSRSAAWLAILAAVLDRPLDVTAEGDAGGAFGAARLGRVAATGEDPFETLTPPPVARTVEPDPSLVAAYAERYAGWRRLYPALKSAM